MVAARENIVFTCAFDRSEPQYVEILNLYKDAFDVMGMDFSFLLVSGARSIASAASGNTDGECTRVHDFIEITGTPNLVRVDTAILQFELQVWSQSRQLSISSIEELPKIGRRIAYRRGFKWLEPYLDQQQDIETIAVNTPDQGLKMLAANRVDLYIGSGMQIANSLESLTLRQPIYLVGKLATVEFYPYLNKRHQHLAAPLAAELQRLLKARGGLIQ